MKLFPIHLIPNDTRFDFMRLRWVTLTISAALFLAVVGLIAVKGFNYALDFTGGTVVELRFAQPAQVDGVRERLNAAGYGSAQVQSFGSGRGPPGGAGAPGRRPPTGDRWSAVQPPRSRH